MASRIDLHNTLCNILGTKNAYFQPPESVKMNYPAIVYDLDNIENRFADDGVYFMKKRYMVTVIHKDPDSMLIDKVAALPTCRFNRHYAQDNLNHDVFTLYF